MGKATAAVFVAIGLVGAGCSGGDSAADPAVEPTPTTAIGDPATPEPEAEPTATAVPTATPEPAEPTVTPEPDLSEDEAAVIEAWERYVELSHQARSDAPSAEALDYASYMTDGALDGALQAVQGDRDAARYIVGPVHTGVSSVSFRLDGDAVVDACIITDYVARSSGDDSVIFDEGEVRLLGRGRLVLIDDRWLVAAKESEVAQCDV